MHLRRQLLLAAAATLATPAILRAQIAPTREYGNLADALAADGRFDSFIELLQAGGGLNTLRGAGNFTLFAPTGPGIDSIPVNIRTDMYSGPVNNNSTSGAGTRNQAALDAFFNLHLVDGRHPVDSFTQPVTLLRSRNGTGLKVEQNAQRNLIVSLADDAGPGVGGYNMPRPATIIAPFITAANGVILPIDHALLK